MLVIDKLEYDVTDILMVNKELTNGENIGIGISPDRDFITLVNIDTSEVLAEEPLVEGEELAIIFRILDGVYGSHEIDDDILTDFAASYVTGDMTPEDM